MTDQMEGWISMEQWLTTSGDSKGAAHKRVADGAWVRGIHYSTPEGDSSFVHEERCLAWMAERARPRIKAAQ